MGVYLHFTSAFPFRSWATNFFIVISAGGLVGGLIVPWQIREKWKNAL